MYGPGYRGNAEVHFLVQGEFNQFICRPDTQYPMPILPLTGVSISGKVVVAVLDSHHFHALVDGHTVHRVGDWLINGYTLTRDPKDYVLNAHLRRYGKQSWCHCCQDGLPDMEERRSLEFAVATVVPSTSYLRGLHLCLQRYGADVVERLLEADGQHFRFQQPPPSQVLAIARQHTVWFKRRGVLYCFAVSRWRHKMQEHSPMNVLLDKRLRGCVTGSFPGLRSFLAGGVLSFL